METLTLDQRASDWHSGMGTFCYLNDSEYKKSTNLTSEHGNGLQRTQSLLLRKKTEKD
jgi:hypothetical protein